jgi:dihydroceramide fatty acyl 2-hydroxylase
MFSVTRECREAAGLSTEEANRLAVRCQSPRGIRLFENGALELASRAHPVTPLVWFVPLLGWGLLRAVPQLGWRAAAIPFAGGWLMFSLFEYLSHRWLFHGLLLGNPGPRRKLWAFLLHGYHHRFPDDPLRLVMPPLLSWPVAALLAVVDELVLGPEVGLAALSGTFAGYLALFATHYSWHHVKLKRGPLGWLRRHHLRHHHRSSRTNFGVTSPVWDALFDTLPRIEEG